MLEHSLPAHSTASACELEINIDKHTAELLIFLTAHLKKKKETFHLLEATYSHRKGACISKNILSSDGSLRQKEAEDAPTGTDQAQLLPEQH